MTELFIEGEKLRIIDLINKYLKEMCHYIN